MTRFARAKGSKASNERLPEDGTQWSVMKQQMVQTENEKREMEKRKEFEKKRQENYQAFLAEQKQPFTEPAWAEFSDNETNNNENQSKNKIDKKKVQKLKKNKVKENGEEVKENGESGSHKVKENGESGSHEEVESNTIELKTKKSKKKVKKNLSNNEESNENSNLNTENDSEMDDDDTSASESTNLDEEGIDKFCNEIDSEENVKYEKLTKKIEKTLNKLETKEKSNTKKRKLSENDDNMKNKNQKKQKSSQILTEDSKPENNNQKKKKGNSTVENNNSLENGKKTKTKKNKTKNLDSKVNSQDNPNINSIEEQNQVNNSETNENMTDSDDDAPVEESIVHTEQKIDLQIKKKKPKKNKKLQISNNIVTEENNDNKSEEKSENQKPRKKEKMRRKPEQNQKQYVLVNGEKQEIVMYSGFPVKKSDAERLQKLKEEMIKKGIPRNEIFHTMKLERRKAEKALTRDKKKVCFQCRQAGHLLSDCPQVGNKATSLIETSGTGICFKCGSTEHTSFNCRVVKDNTYKFAKCFICGEQGHVSRQCPDNPQGLYPQGGGCRMCGDVTHLKKDCPQFQQKQEENTIKLNTITSFSNVEDDFPDSSKVITKPNIVKPKIVKF
ncbi:myb-like protein X isoform X3 [Chrysoperla carnea]|uniref:myb-like protein X isoform X3 n=1 Tax=Chrysoperla carnea TaxID=189513 RepID=UPI001D062508|nr:myb-like protein X isoform X3 [Chrysoperla carnea]